jgi:exopolyphosphatase/guanosine-5'-triphosphate,3'-diphosphate pyrophosphatase
MEETSDDQQAAAPGEESRASCEPAEDVMSLVRVAHRGQDHSCQAGPLADGQKSPISGRRRGGADPSPVYAALDLGTNNCRLLVARPSRRGFRVLDAFSRIIRLGEGVMTSGRLSEAAMARTWDALTICAAKMRRHRVARSRLVATEACRIAENGPEFVARVARELGLEIEIVSREAEAKLAVSGCASLLDTDADLALVFDIGGGSSELIWLDLAQRKGPWRRSLADRLEAMSCITGWTSLPVGVVTLAERFGGRHVTADGFEAMVEAVTQLLAPFEAEHRFRDRIAHGKALLLGTSGTVTTVAGIQLGLPRYDRSRVDGCWLDVVDARAVTYDLLSRSYEQRVAEPCIGKERADLVLAGCAILEALLRMWPADRLRVADRGLREGILATMMAGDGHFRSPGRSRRWPRRDN